MDALQATVEELWAGRDDLAAGDGDALAVVRQAIDRLDRGEARVAEVDPGTGDVVVHQWLKQAILLMFRLAGMQTQEVGPFEYADKLPLKHGFEAAGVRVVPGASARWGAFLERGVILMPSYVNIGARVGAGTMVDTWATVGSCAQIGARVHLSGGVGIGGVLEPPQAAPVIVGDDAFVGSRVVLTEGARVGPGAVVATGCVVSASIPVIDVESGEEVARGDVPAWSVVIPGSRPKEYPGGTFGVNCLLRIKQLPEGERHAKSSLNQLLRGHGVAL
jgi:2,3,4,5-tetrahydropyridine-2-carboxylate N-succinyltransferase